MPKSLRSNLIEALQDELVTAIVGKGYQRIDLTGEERQAPEIRSAFPLGRLQKLRTNGDIELIEIQLDKGGSAKFRLNFGIVPAAGIDHPVKHIPATEACVHFLPLYANLYRWPLLLRWFGVTADASRLEISALIAKVIGYLPEVDQWLLNRKRGRHVREVRNLSTRR